MTLAAPDPSRIIDAVGEWHAAHCAVIPASIDGQKKPTVDWKEFQNRRPNRRQLELWFGKGHPGFGIVCGAISGNLEMLEFEGRAVDEGLDVAFAQLLEQAGYGDLWKRVTDDGYWEQTPSGGLHLVYRVCGRDVPANTKLAERLATAAELAANPKQRRKVLIETRGEGGFVIVAPSGGAVHPTGKPWVALGASQPATIPTITAEERDTLVAIARSLDQLPEPPAPPARPATAHTGGLRPGDDYEAKTDWDDILGPAGWTHVYTHGRTRYWRRPGKDRGISATTGHSADRDRLYVFSSSTEFPTETPLTKFAAYALLHHGGDHAAAARELRRRGFGGDGSTKPAPAPRAADSATEPAQASGGTMIETEAPAESLREELPHILTGSAPETIRALDTEINRGTLPDVYVTDGRLVAIGKVSGDPNVPVTSQVVTPELLAALLAQHTYTYKRTKDGEMEVTPPQRVLASVLSTTYWPRLRALRGIIGSPVLRPDGTLLQTPGYDAATGLYLAPKVSLPAAIPARPSRAQVAASRRFLLEILFADFPWVADADRANYVALLITQTLRPFTGCLSPLGLVDATTPASGKTLLAEAIALLHGMTSATWGNDDNELRKVITAKLSSDNAQVIVWDNLKEGTVIDSPVLAQLLTSEVWHDRVLGSNKTFSALNTRQWLATGNSLRIGGDMASRAVLVRLDPKMARPELRTGFEIPNLDQWIRVPDNRAVLLTHLLTLILDWIAAGAPRSAHVMRQFTTWAQAVGGFCAHHGIDGFLANSEEVHSLDDADSEWVGFLTGWQAVFGNRAVTSREVLDSADNDTWQGRFLISDDGRALNAKSLGWALRGHIGRPHGGRVLRNVFSKYLNQQTWRVEALGE